MADLERADFENPNPNIHDLFTYYNQIYFEGKLGPCTVKWSSKRMTLCAGICQYSTYGGCEIRLSEPLLKYRPVADLKNTLLHEMIHAYLFLTNGNKDHDDHGSCFQHMMMMINNFSLVDEERPQDGYAVTIYHNFTNEVELYRTHHWRCVKCADLIKRAMNRTPSVSDCLTRTAPCSHPRCHWHTHQKRCGGSYEKIREPAGYVDKRKKPTQASADIKEADRQGVGGDDPHLSASEQKRKMGNNGEASRKKTKDSQVQVKTANLEDYFVPVQKDAGKIGYVKTEGVEKDVFSEKLSGDKNLSDGGVKGKRKFSTLNDISQRETLIDLTEEADEVNFRSLSSFVNKNGEEAHSVTLASSRMQETNVKAADEDVRKSLRCKRASSPPRKGKEIIASKDSRQTVAGKAALGIGGESPSRKRYRKVDELLKKQVCREPLVILAWKNWVSYESDEEEEEPLIDRRAKRRKQEVNSKVITKGTTVLNSSEMTELVLAQDDSEHEVKNCLDNQVLFSDDSEKENPMKGRGVENKVIFVELSDDGKGLEASGNKSHVSQ